MSLPVDADSRHVYLFAIDLRAGDCVWLNLAADRGHPVSSETERFLLRRYFARTKNLNLRDFFAMLAARVVPDPRDAGVIVSDQASSMRDGQELIRSCDTARILQLMCV